MNRQGRRNQQHSNSWIFRYCPALLYLNCSCHTCIIWASLGLLPASWRLPQLRTWGEGQQQWELLPWLPTTPSQDCALLQITPLTFFFFFFYIKYEPGWHSGIYDSGMRECKSYFMSFVLLSIFTPTESRQLDGCHQCMAPLNSPRAPREVSPGMEKAECSLMRLASCQHQGLPHPLLTS